MLYFMIVLLSSMLIMAAIVAIESSRHNKTHESLLEEISSLKKRNEILRVDNEFYRDAYTKLARDRDDIETRVYQAEYGTSKTS